MPLGDIIFLLFVVLCLGVVAVVAVRSRRRNAHTATAGRDSLPVDQNAQTGA
jgi:hypothetical protein